MLRQSVLEPAFRLVPKWHKATGERVTLIYVTDDGRVELLPVRN